jgi:hypothetical protein
MKERPKTTLHPIFIVYRRPMFFTDKVLQLAGAGDFIHCELFIPEKLATFGIFLGGKMQMRSDLCGLYVEKPELFSWHRLDLDNLEFESFMNYNIDLVNKCKYNTSDLLFQLLPKSFLRVMVEDLDHNEERHPQKLFCSQAILLTLRNCVREGTRNAAMLSVVKNANSRLVTPTDLSHLLYPLLGSPQNSPVLTQGILGQLKASVHERYYFS